MKIWCEIESDSVHYETKVYAQTFTGLQSFFLTQQVLLWSELEPLISCPFNLLVYPPR